MRRTLSNAAVARTIDLCGRQWGLGHVTERGSVYVTESFPVSVLVAPGVLGSRVVKRKMCTLDRERGLRAIIRNRNRRNERGIAMRVRMAQERRLREKQRRRDDVFAECRADWNAFFKGRHSVAVSGWQA